MKYLQRLAADIPAAPDFLVTSCASLELNLRGNQVGGYDLCWEEESDDRGLQSQFIWQMNATLLPGFRCPCSPPRLGF